MTKLTLLVLLLLLAIMGFCVMVKEALDRKKKLGKWRSGEYGELGERLTRLEATLSSQEWPGLWFEYGKKKWITSIITAQLAGQTLSDLLSGLSLTRKVKTNILTIWGMVEAEITSSCEQKYHYYQEEQEASREGEQQEVNGESLRHTFATEMLRAGMSLPVLMKVLGHRTIDMTLRYAEVTGLDIQRAYANTMAAIESHYEMPHFPAVHRASNRKSARRAVLTHIETLATELEAFRRD